MFQYIMNINVLLMSQLSNLFIYIFFIYRPKGALLCSLYQCQSVVYFFLCVCFRILFVPHYLQSIMSVPELTSQSRFSPHRPLQNNCYHCDQWLRTQPASRMPAHRPGLSNSIKSVHNMRARNSLKKKKNSKPDSEASLAMELKKPF